MVEIKFKIKYWFNSNVETLKIRMFCYFKSLNEELHNNKNKYVIFI